MKQLFRNEQILIDHAVRRDGERFICGGCSCPVCSQRIEVAIIGKRGLGFVTPESRCPHTDMAVSAGGLDIAVMFRVPLGGARLVASGLSYEEMMKIMGDD